MKRGGLRVTIATLALLAPGVATQAIEKTGATRTNISISNSPATTGNDRHGLTSSEGPADSLRGSDLIGAGLKTGGGREYGEIHDLVIDPATGVVNYAIIGVNVSSHAQALAPVPWSALNIRSETSFVARIDQQKLESGPEMSRQQWEDLMKSDHSVRELPFQPPSEMGGSDRIPGESGELDKVPDAGL